MWAKYPNISPYVRVRDNPLRFVDDNGESGILAQAGGYVTAPYGGGMVEVFIGYDITENSIVLGASYSNFGNNLSQPDIGVYAGGTTYIGAMESGMTGFVMVDAPGDIIASVGVSGNTKDIKNIKSVSDVKSIVQNGQGSVTVGKSLSGNPASTIIMGGVKASKVIKIPLPKLTSEKNVNEQNHKIVGSPVKKESAVQKMMK